jgi:hypothetical protein
MPGDIESFMTADHARLDALLARASQDDGTIDADAYQDFREGLLRHIAMEEKVLLPFARAKRGEPLAMAKKLRADHGELASLLVPSPTHALCESLRAKLVEHNALEEGEAGLYVQCDSLAGAEASSVVARLRAQPRVPVAPHYDGPLLKRRGAR